MRNKTDGVTIVELIIVMGIVVVLAGAGLANFFGARERQVVNSQVDRAVADLRETMNRSRSQDAGEGWGIRFNNPTGDGNDYYEIWHGTSYAAGTVTRRVQLDSSIAFTDPSDASLKDIIFAEATGLPTAGATVAFVSLKNAATATIDVNIQGSVEYSIGQ